MKTRWKTLSLAILLLGGASQALAQANISAKIDDVTVTTTAGVVKAANSFRYALSCTNNGTVGVRWGKSDITVTGGQRIPAGASIEIFNRADIYMIAESGTAVVSCTEEVK